VKPLWAASGNRKQHTEQRPELARLKGFSFDHVGSDKLRLNEDSPTIVCRIPCVVASAGAGQRKWGRTDTREVSEGGGGGVHKSLFAWTTASRTLTQDAAPVHMETSPRLYPANDKEHE
jgi:hypothetical protein